MSNKEKWQYAIVIVIIVLIIAGAYIGVYLQNNVSYNKAIEKVGQEQYTEAIDNLKQIERNNNLESDFKKYLSYADNEFEKFYKDSDVIYAYAFAMAEYEDKDMYTTEKYLDYIPEDYSGELSEDIKAFKLEFVPEYEEFLK